MPKDLVCPLEKNCGIYKDYLTYTPAEYDKIIRGAIDGYSCRALNIINVAKMEESECALIQLLNNTETLLKLSGKGTL